MPIGLCAKILYFFYKRPNQKYKKMFVRHVFWNFLSTRPLTALPLLSVQSTNAVLITCQQCLYAVRFKITSRQQSLGPIAFLISLGIIHSYAWSFIFQVLQFPVPHFSVLHFQRRPTSLIQCVFSYFNACISNTFATCNSATTSTPRAVLYVTVALQGV